MKKFVTLACLVVAVSAEAWDPEPCKGALAYLVPKLKEKNLLIKPSNEAPGASYINEGQPSVCVASADGGYNWLIHKHADGVTVLVERYEFKTTKSAYYGPFKSADNK